VHVAPAPSLTLTVPVGVPAPGATGATLKVTVTGWPAAAGFGLIEETVVVVVALFTFCTTAPEALAAKLLELA